MTRRPALLLLLSLSPSLSAQTGQPSILGRWDLTIQNGNREDPSWLEIRRSGGRTLVGQLVGVAGSARPIAKIDYQGGVFGFSLPPQWEQGSGDLSFEGRRDGERLSGSMTTADGRKLSWTGTRAPTLRRTSEPQWGEPVRLFNGSDLAGWHALGDNRWQAVDGILRNTAPGGNLVTDATFTDFKLHIEFRYPKGGNSGVYLRGRYEVQIEDSANAEPASDLLGGVYGFLAPSELLARPPGEWQSFDITLVGRLVTVAVNGKTVICHREIPGITGGALDSREAEPGPIFLQGDHGPIEYRNIVLTRARP